MRETRAFFLAERVWVFKEANGTVIRRTPKTETMENRTDASGLGEDEISAALFEFKVFNIVVSVLAFCTLAVSGVYCLFVCYGRTRQSKRAHVYESAVTQGEPDHPVSVRAVKRSASFVNPLAFLRRSERARDNSRIYYIYSNPLPIGLKEEEEEEEQREVAAKVNWDPGEDTSASLEEYAKDPNSGVVLEPPVFYMQL